MERIEIEGNSVMRFTYGPDDPVVIVEFEGEALGRAHIAPTQDSTLFTEARPLYELQEKITELEQLNEALLAQVSGILAVGKTTEV
jgi:hypothetical protein